MNYCQECMDALGETRAASNWIEDSEGESRWLCSLCYESVMA